MRIILNLTGLIIGSAVITANVFVIGYLIIHYSAMIALMYAAAGSVFIFSILQFLPIVLLKRIFGLGIAIAFVGSTIVALSYTNIKYNENDLLINKPLKISSFKEVANYPDSNYFMIDGYKALEDFTLSESFKSYRKTDNYFIMPLRKESTLKLGDTIEAYAGYIIEQGLFQKDKSHYLKHIHSANSYLWIFKNETRVNRFRSMVDNFLEKSNNAFVVNENVPFFEFYDPAINISYWTFRFHLGLIVINAIWLAFALMFINAKKQAITQVESEV